MPGLAQVSGRKVLGDIADDRLLPCFNGQLIAHHYVPARPAAGTTQVFRHVRHVMKQYFVDDENRIAFWLAIDASGRKTMTLHSLTRENVSTCGAVSVRNFSSTPDPGRAEPDPRSQCGRVRYAQRRPGEVPSAPVRLPPAPFPRHRPAPVD
jgi:hypothetical protein